MGRQIPIAFTGIPCGNFEQLNPLITKCRLRIFYLGLNRNGGYITKEFANKLLATLPYVPVVGDYDEVDEDFTTHRDKDIARSYGVVPENPNITWEKHLDDDGIERTYATCDVYLWTGRYEVAKEIVGKPHSLELDPESIQGSWKTVEGNRFGYEYTDARFIGLSVLGDNVEPCFEGSAFYSLISNYALAINELLEKIKNNGGSERMELVNYRLSHDETYRNLFSLLNPNFTEEGNWEYDSEIVDVYDDYVLTYQCKPKKYMRVSYSKENDNVILGEATEVKITDVTLEEFAILESIKSTYSLNSFSEINAKIEELNNSLETANASLETANASLVEKDSAIAEKDASIETYSNDLSGKNSKIVELENSVSTYELEVANKETEIQNLNTELDGFKAEKATYELKQKEAKVLEYEEFLLPASIEKINEKLSDYSLNELEKELRNFAFEDKPELLRNKLVPTGEKTSKNDGGIISILEKYKNK